MYHNCRCQHSAFFFFFQTNFSVFASLGPEHNQAIMYHSTEWKYEPSISSRESAITHCVKSKMPLHSSGVDLCKRCRVLYTYMHVYIVRHSQVTECYPLMTCHFFLCSGWFAKWVIWFGYCESVGLVIDDHYLSVCSFETNVSTAPSTLYRWARQWILALYRFEIPDDSINTFINEYTEHFPNKQGSRSKDDVASTV